MLSHQRTVHSIAVVALISMASVCSAVSITANSSTTGFATSSTDLIEGLAPTTISGTSDQEGIGSDSTGAALTNGLFAAAGLGSPGTDLTIVNNGAVITYTLPANPLGYNISEIDTYSAWRDAGRVNQDYKVYATTLTNPTFTLIATVDKGYSGGNPTALQVQVTGTPLGQITALEFAFPSTQNGYVGYREIDVIGTLAPEPSTFILGGLGLVGLFCAARRRKT